MHKTKIFARDSRHSDFDAKILFVVRDTESKSSKIPRIFAEVRRCPFAKSQDQITPRKCQSDSRKANGRVG